MSFLSNLFKKCSSQPGVSHAEKLYIVDAAGLNEGPRKNDVRLSPRNQIDILQALSRVSKNENITIHAVFEGRPLKKVAHGKKFDEVVVFFCEEAKALPKFIIGHLKDWMRRKDVTIITADRRLEEQVLAAGGKSMRMSTFKKAFENTAARRRKPRQNRRKSGGGGGGGNDNPERKQSKPDQPEENDVSTLIDLVD